MALFPTHIFTNDSTKMLPLFVAVISVVFGVMVIKDGRHILHVYKDVSKQETNRHDMIAEAKRNGKTEIVLPPLFLTDRINTKMRINFGRYFARDITRKPSMENNVYAKYHGMKKVSRE
jgi:hypothetical protein